MNHESLKNYLYDHIPLTRAMQIEIVEVSDSSLTLTAPSLPTSITGQPSLVDALQHSASSQPGPSSTVGSKPTRSSPPAS